MVPRRNRLTNDVSILPFISLPAMTDKLHYQIARYFQNIKGTTNLNNNDIDTIVSILEKSFAVEDSVDNFQTLSFYPVDLPQIFDAGVEKLKLSASSDALRNAESDPKFHGNKTLSIHS
jgi:hypothetical protein